LPWERRKTSEKLFYLTLNDLNEYLQTPRRHQQNIKKIKGIFHSEEICLLSVTERVVVYVMYPDFKEGFGSISCDVLTTN